MKIRVVRNTGEQEIITLTPPVTTIESVDGGLSRIVDATGMEHWFSDDNGIYDGWGRAVNFPTMKQAIQEIELVEQSRDHVDPIIP